MATPRTAGPSGRAGTAQRLWQAARWSAGVAALLLASLAAPAQAQSPAPDASEVATLRDRLKAVGLTRAEVVQGGDGRLTLQGSYRDRAEVLTAFSIAQQVVGVKWVAPTTPENIRYVFDNALDKFCAALGTCKSAAPGQPAVPGAPGPSAPPGGGRAGGAQGVPGAVVAAAPPVSTGARPPAAGAPRKYGLVVGVGEFENLDRDKWLMYTPRDAQLVYDYLVDPRGAGFARGNVTLLTNQQASRAAIESAMDQIANQAGPGDLVLLYISSHGTPPNDRGTMQVITYDTRLKPREQIFLSSLTDDRIAAFAQRLGPARLVAILDTCYSGAAFEKVPGFLATGAKDLRLDDERSTVVGYSGKSLHTLATGAKDLSFEDEKAPLPPPGNQGPRVLMSASDAGQRSWESERLRQSFFTHHLVAALRSTPDLERAYLQAKPRVSAEVLRDKGQNQTPQAVFMPRGSSLSLR